MDRKTLIPRVSGSALGITVSWLFGITSFVYGCGSHGAARAPVEKPALAPNSAPNAPSATVRPALPDLRGRRVRVGSDVISPPFEWLSREDDRVVGFDPDLMAEIASRIHIVPQFVDADFSTIFVALAHGEFDLVMSAATITKERKKVVAFSVPYIKIGQMIVRKTGNRDMRGYQDLARGVLVGVCTGTTGEEAARTTARVPEDRLKRYHAFDLAFTELANGSIDAIIGDGPSVGHYASDARFRDRVEVVGEPFTVEAYGIAARKQDTDLLSAINAAIQALEQDGTIARLKAKYHIP